MARRIQTLLFYLLVFLIPSQLGKHFFFPFSYVWGIRVDYLAPTIYLTDLIIIFLILFEIFFLLFKSKKILLLIGQRKKYSILGLGFLLGYVFLQTLLLAQNKQLAFYSFVKLCEYIALGCVIVRIKPSLRSVLIFFYLSLIFSILIGTAQVYVSHSLNGILWFLGERTFYSSSPGIATITLWGQKWLRAYATFPHPNVFGGVLSLGIISLLSVLVFDKKIHKKRLSTVLLLFFIYGLILTFSKYVWIVTVGMAYLIYVTRREVVPLLQIKKITLIGCLYCVLFISILVPQTIVNSSLWTSVSLRERANLLNYSIQMITSQKALGVGLNNSITQQLNYILGGTGVYIFQPVHNIFVLLTVELGLGGFVVFFSLFLSALFQAQKNNPSLFYVLITVFLLGLFDHYFFTLQQGQLVFTLFVSLAFMKGRHLANKVKNAKMTIPKL